MGETGAPAAAKAAMDAGSGEILYSVGGGIARVTLNRPQKHNSFNEAMRDRLTEIFINAGENPAVRLVILASSGESFCSGADLEWMKKAASYTMEQNIEDAERLARMFWEIKRCPKPVIARVQGAAIGGGAGFVSCSDIAVASKSAVFGFSEVKIGIIPAVISPHVIEKIGTAAARELFITGERFGAEKALKVGLVSEAVEPAELDAAVEKKAQLILSSAPGAVGQCKALVRDVSRLQDERLIKYTVEKIAQVRSGPEAKEGFEAFLQKRKADWASK